MFLLKSIIHKSKDETTITVTLRDRERSLVRLLQDIKNKANVGHSYEVITDPDDTENKGRFGIDGDGGFHINEIQEDGKLVKGGKIAHPALLKSRKLHGYINFQGMDISVETGRSRIRQWYNPHDGSQGMSRMTLPYGYIKGTLGTDGDHVDVFVGPDHSAGNVYVVHTTKAPDFTKYDEDKCFVGLNSPEEATWAFNASYSDPRFFGGMSIWTMDEFKDALKTMRGQKLEQLAKSAQCSRSQAKEVGNKIGADWNKISLAEFHDGLCHEYEHDDVTNGDPVKTGKIALAHLKEDPHYYSKLKRAGID